MIFSRPYINNTTLMYINTVVYGMLFFLPVLALYYEESLFTATNVAIVFGVESFAMGFFEIPTGIVSDYLGRKKSLLLANLFHIIAFAFLAIGQYMIMFILFSICNACARSLVSGTDSALIYDTLKSEEKEGQYQKTIGTYFSLWPLGASVASIVGGYIAIWELEYTVYASFFPMIISSGILLLLKEPKSCSEEKVALKSHTRDSLLLLIKNSRLLILVIVSCILISFGEIIHDLGPIFLKSKEIPIVYFGYILSGVFGFSALGHYFSHTVSDTLGNKNALIIITFLSPLCYLLATFFENIWVIVFWMLPSIFFGLRNPIINSLINHELDSKKRATVLSINNFVGQMGVAIISPFFGYFVELYSISTAIMLSCCLLFFVPCILFFLQSVNERS